MGKCNQHTHTYTERDKSSRVQRTHGLIRNYKWTGSMVPVLSCLWSTIKVSKCRSELLLTLYCKALNSIGNRQPTVLHGRKSWGDHVFRMLSGCNVENDSREGSLEAGRTKFRWKKRRSQEVSERTRHRTSNLATDTLNQGGGQSREGGEEENQSILSEWESTEAGEKHVSKSTRSKAKWGSKPRWQWF